jgi:hypothetical protein
VGGERVGGSEVGHDVLLLLFFFFSFLLLESGLLVVLRGGVDGIGCSRGLGSEVREVMCLLATRLVERCKRPAPSRNARARYRKKGKTKRLVCEKKLATYLVVTCLRADDGKLAITSPHLTALDDHTLRGKGKDPTASASLRMECLM